MDAETKIAAHLVMQLQTMIEMMKPFKRKWMRSYLVLKIKSIRTIQETVYR